MRMCGVLLLATNFLLTVKAHVGIPDAGVTQFLTYAPTNRLLRYHKSLNIDNNEERGVGTAAVESLTNSLKSTTSTHQLQDWLEKGKTTDDVFKLLTLDKAADNLLDNPQLRSWIDYMNRFNAKHPNQQTTLIKTLTSHYDDVALAKIIEGAKLNPATETMAKRLQTEQLYRWLLQQKKPEDIFTLMKLNKAGEQLFKDPLVVTWARYVDVYNKANPNQKTTLFSGVKTYNDETLAQMLLAAKSAPNMEKIAVRIQADLTNVWLFDLKKTPNDVFRVLKLKDDSQLLENPIFISWMKYLDDFNMMHPQNTETVISTLAKQYSSPKLGTMLIEAQKNPTTAKLAKQLYRDMLKNWLENGNTPSYVFKRLQLPATGDNLLDSPLFTTWLEYVSYFRKKRPRQKTSAISILSENYKDGVLAKILVDARNVKTTESTAAGLLDSLTIGWMHRKHDVPTPATVYKWLLVDGTPEDDAVRKLYNSYKVLYDMKYP